MKTLIVYYSFTQNNEKLAKHLQKQLNCDLAKIETVKKRTGFSIFLDLLFNRKPDLKSMPYYLHDYNHVIFVAPIWAGRIAMPMKSFLVSRKSDISQYSFITLCGGGGAAQQEKIHKELVATLQHPPVKFMELRVNDLLPADKKGAIKHTQAYRIDTAGFSNFNRELTNFIKQENLLNSI